MTKKTAKEEAQFLLRDKKPEPLISNSLRVTIEELEKIPRQLTCKKHGSFNLKTTEPFLGKCFVNSVCSECLSEFDDLVSEKEKEIEEERTARATEERVKKRMSDLKGRGVSKRSIDKSFFNYTADTKEKEIALNKCKHLCEKVKKDEKAFNLIMTGGVGTGKTHLANSAVIDLYDSNKCGVRMNMIDIIRRIKRTWSKDSDESESDVIEMFVKTDLLIIDEVGVQFNSDTEKMFIFDIINGRYEECLPTVIISNLDINGVKDVIGDRCVDRLREDGGKVVAFTWDSYR